MFTLCKLFFCYHSLENVADIDVFWEVPLPVAKHRIFNRFIQNLPFLCVTK